MENPILLGLFAMLFIGFIIMIFMIIKFYRASGEEKAKSTELQKVIDKFSKQVTSRRTIKSMDTHLKQLSKTQEGWFGQITTDFGKRIVKAADEAVRQQKGVLGEIIVSKALELEFGRLYRLGGELPADAMGIKDELIQFIEIKTENEKLTANEAQFKKLIDEGKVAYQVIKLGSAIPQSLKQLKGELFLDKMPSLPAPKLTPKERKILPCKYCGKEFEQSGQGFRQRMEHYAYRKRNGGQCSREIKKEVICK